MQIELLREYVTNDSKLQKIIVINKIILITVNYKKL